MSSSTSRVKRIRRSDDEVMALLRDNFHPLSIARAEFANACGQLEQSDAGPIERRRLEFEAVERIAAAINAPRQSE